MTVSACYFQERILEPLPLDKVSIVKTWVSDATELFTRFCTRESTWRYLAKDQNNLWPHLKKINAFCVSTEDSSLSEGHLKSINAILRVNPSLLDLCINTTQDVKNFQTTLLKIHCNTIYEIAENHLQCLLETHFQAIEKVHELRPDFLKIYLKIIEKYSLNNVDNLLTHHIYGIYTSFNILKKTHLLGIYFFKKPTMLGIYDQTY